jgi:hypothetical protein
MTHDYSPVTHVENGTEPSKSDKSTVKANEDTAAEKRGSKKNVGR